MENDVIATSKSTIDIPCFLVGLGAGVALTLLFAPKSGGQTRRLISRHVKDSTDWVKDTATAAGESVSSRVEELRDRVKDVAEAVGLH